MTHLGKAGCQGELVSGLCAAGRVSTRDEPSHSLRMVIDSREAGILCRARPSAISHPVVHPIR